jgi:ubiquinone/menaquinone biosynthesis C-methylase UbiE
MKRLNLLQQPEVVIRQFEFGWRKPENREIAKRFGKEFFDGDRINGYGGYKYDGRWKDVAKKIKDIYNLKENNSVLDIGCAKGFLVYDLKELIPGITVLGLDISSYSLNNALDGFDKYIRRTKNIEVFLEDNLRKEISPFLIKGSADELPWSDNSFDLVLSINTLHNLPLDRCEKAIKEMIRVSKNKEKMFIQVDSYRNNKEQEAIFNWNLTAQTILSTEEWTNLFKKNNYKGDYFWTIIQKEENK